MDTLHQIIQYSRTQTSSSSEMDLNVLGLSIPYLYAVYIYNRQDYWDASE